MNSILNLPVFQLAGGTAKLRAEFINRVMAELDLRLLCSTLLQCNNRTDMFTMSALVKQFDLVMVEGAVDFPVQQIEIGREIMAGSGNLSWSGGDDLREFMTGLLAKLDSLVRRMEVWACVLIGGRSSRMGRPKHLIEDDSGITWLERTTDILRPLVDGLVVSGGGMLPERLSSVTRLPDIPEVAGPLTGILAASRWQPMVSWLLVACDMPHISTEALQWLLSGRRPGCWGRVPRLAEKEHCEPLFAWYDLRAAQFFERQLYSGNLRIGTAAAHPKIDNPSIPASLCHAWQNFNSPDQLR
jgi:molybdopterin-guanine dinucleotide biosynthesis protein A